MGETLRCKLAMKILMPMFQSARSDIYLSEFAALCETFATVNESWDAFWNVQGDYEFLHLHWPEYYYNWGEPTVEQLVQLDDILSRWKSKSKLVITRHNYFPHSGQTEKYDQLYRTFFKHVHVVQHLGTFSKEEFFERYAGAGFLNRLKHVVIPHHFFYSYPSGCSRQEARERLGIKAGKLVMMVFGNVRNKKEKKLIADAFRSLNHPNKLLLVPRWLQPGQSKSRALKENISIFGLGYLQGLISGNIILRSAFVKHEEVQWYFNASDIVFLSRINSLNSGIPYMGYQFPVPMLGPAIGNIKESIEHTGGRVYDPGNIADIKRVINEAAQSPSSNRIPGINVNEQVIAALKEMYSSV
jgi:hypothetical protein